MWHDTEGEKMKYYYRTWELWFLELKLKPYYVKLKNYLKIIYFYFRIYICVFKGYLFKIGGSKK